VVVTKPPGRVEVRPERDTVASHTGLAVELRAYDRQGRPIPQPPLELRVEGPGQAVVLLRPDSMPAYALDTPGRPRLIARLGRLADTAYVTVRRCER
jgi:hypothetical protein